MFFCLLTPTLWQLVFKQKKMSLCAENSAWWKMALSVLKLRKLVSDSNALSLPPPLLSSSELEFPSDHFIIVWLWSSSIFL